MSRITIKDCRVQLDYINNLFNSQNQISIYISGINPSWKTLYRNGTRLTNPVATYRELYDNLVAYKNGLEDYRFTHNFKYPNIR
jgi:hypothetical protein